MSLEAHVANLSEKHQVLERQLDDAMKHAWWDESRLRQLKLEKLKVKDELTRLGRQ